MIVLNNITFLTHADARSIDSDLEKREEKTEKVSLEMNDTSSEVEDVEDTEESEMMIRIVQENVADDSGMIHY